MGEATIRFEGEAFHGMKWTEFLRHLGFRLSGGPDKAVYVFGGNNVVSISCGFVMRDEKQGYEWQVELKQTRRWEGTIKFYSVLLAAFAMPQKVIVNLADQVFTDRRSLRTHAEAAILRDFSLEELTDFGVYRIGDGVQFV